MRAEQFLETLQQLGKAHFTTSEAKEIIGTSPGAVKALLQRLEYA